MYTILFSNLGYARGIDGRLASHLRYAYRHVYVSRAVQQTILDQLKKLIEREQPDLCCFVEIDQGSRISGKFNQLGHLINNDYPFSDIENKYAPESLLRKLIHTSGKSNGFLSRAPHPFVKQYFSSGVKRLIYEIHMDDRLSVFFCSFFTQ